MVAATVAEVAEALEAVAAATAGVQRAVGALGAAGEGVSVGSERWAASVEAATAVVRSPKWCAKVHLQGAS